jgi:hypothetical protein
VTPVGTFADTWAALGAVGAVVTVGVALFAAVYTVSSNRSDKKDKRTDGEKKKADQEKQKADDEEAEIRRKAAADHEILLRLVRKLMGEPKTNVWDATTGFIADQEQHNRDMAEAITNLTNALEPFIVLFRRNGGSSFIDKVERIADPAFVENVNKVAASIGRGQT